MFQRGAVWAGRYRIEAPLGSGGEAHTFEVYDLAEARPLALKLLHGGAGAARFRAEFALLRSATLT
jgi:hypothetical protein